MQMAGKWDLLWVAGGEELWGKSRDCPCVLLDCSCHITGQTSFPWLKKHWTPLFGCMTLRMVSLHLWFNLDKSFFYTHLTYLEYIHSFARLSARAGFTFLGKTENHAVMPLLSQCCSPSTRTPQQEELAKAAPKLCRPDNPHTDPQPSCGPAECPVQQLSHVLSSFLCALSALLWNIMFAFTALSSFSSSWALNFQILSLHAKDTSVFLQGSSSVLPLSLCLLLLSLSSSLSWAGLLLCLLDFLNSAVACFCALRSCVGINTKQLSCVPLTLRAAFH